MGTAEALNMYGRKQQVKFPAHRHPKAEILEPETLVSMAGFSSQQILLRLNLRRHRISAGNQ